MKLKLSTLETLSEMICGASGGHGFSWDNFPYRSSSYLTQFFTKCDLKYLHDGSTRQIWVSSVLQELNEKPSSNPNLPSDELIRVICQLADPFDFERSSLNYDAAINQINRVLSKDGLQIRFINGECVVENLRTTIRSITSASGRVMNREENVKYNAIARFLERASEDEFTEELLTPLLKQLGFDRVTTSGHTDKQMEFGKDVWMRYRLPTSHQLYIGVQVKKGRIHASGAELNTNISGILAQLLMLMTYPIFDPETNSKHLPDHVILVTSGEITKQARTLLSEFLDNAMRRNVLFLDKEDILELCIKFAIPLPEASDNDIPW